jgi:cytochrome c oxidase assembly protein subunit 15
MAMADIATEPAGGQEAHRRAVRLWLWCVAGLIFAMVVVGGATRLTESGLSIVEWKPVTGAVPPLSEAAWHIEFDKYKAIPQYQLVNKGMSLDDFKTIYWWEWSHRQLGRLIGLAFVLPLAAFWVMGWIEPRLKPRLIGLLALGASQGALGWWMVASGLSERTDVSQYRLAAHMTLACLIFAAVVWVARSLAPVRPRTATGAGDRLIGMALVPLTLLQIFLGGLVAGLDAGLSHNTWPLMDGHFFPPLADLYIMRPAWVNHFENAMTVQFQHRMLAYALFALTIWHAWTLRGRGDAGRRALALAALVAAQAAIGVATLLLMVPIGWALLHQAAAVALLAMATVHAEALHRGAATTAREAVTVAPA